MSVVKKVVDMLVPVLIQTAIVLSVSSFFILDYVDRADDKVIVHIENSDRSEGKVVALSLMDIIEQTRKDNRTDKEINEYVDKLLDGYDQKGYTVIDAASIITAPKSIYIKPESFEDVMKQK